MFKFSSFTTAFARDIRIGHRVMVETFGGLYRSGWMNLVILLTMTSILTIFGSLTLFTLDSQQLVERWGNSASISVYLKDKATLADMEPELRSLPHIVKTDSLPKSEAWERYRRRHDEAPDIPNPLPDTIHLEVDSPKHVAQLIRTIRALPEVEAIRYPYDFIRRIQQLTQGISIFGILFTAFLGILTLFIISNTLSLLIQSRRREIEILRMMGVSNWYIRLPFLLQGAFYGLLGAVLAFTPVASFQIFVRKVLSFFQWNIGGQNLYLVLALMLVIGVVVGAIGAVNSMKKYLKV